jgi:transcriptional regulator with XRE-family HTH domain
MLKTKLKEIRKKTGISQNKLAKLLVEKGVLKHCTPAYISAMENKKFTNFDFFCQICEMLGRDVKVVITKKQRHEADNNRN